MFQQHCDKASQSGLVSKLLSDLVAGFLKNLPQSRRGAEKTEVVMAVPVEKGAGPRMRRIPANPWRALLCQRQRLSRERGVIF